MQIPAKAGVQKVWTLDQMQTIDIATSHLPDHLKWCSVKENAENYLTS